MLNTTRPLRQARFMVRHQIDRLRHGNLDADQRQRAINSIEYWRLVHSRHAAELGMQRMRAQQTVAEIVAEMHETANTDWEERA